jgi:hypothetical protein
MIATLGKNKIVMKEIPRRRINGCVVFTVKKISTDQLGLWK